MSEKILLSTYAIKIVDNNKNYQVLLEIPIKLTTLNRSKLTTYFTGEEVKFKVCIG